MADAPAPAAAPAAAARPRFTAKQRYARISARKMRYVVDLIRGKAMNPVSHPCGGGDGRGGVGRHPCNWKGTKLAKGGKTRRSKKPSNRFIARFRRAGPHQNTRR